MSADFSISDVDTGIFSEKILTGNIKKRSRIFTVLFLCSTALYSVPGYPDTLTLHIRDTRQSFWNGQRIAASALSGVSTGLFVCSLIEYIDLQKTLKRHNDDLSEGIGWAIEVTLQTTLITVYSISGGVCSLTSIPFWIAGHRKSRRINLKPAVSIDMDRHKNPRMAWGLTMSCGL